MKSKKGSLEWDTLIPWIIGIILFLLIAGVLFVALTDSGKASLDTLIKLFRFSR